MAMPAKKQQTLLLQQRMGKQRVKEAVRAELLRRLAELLVQAVRKHREQGETPWRR